MAAENINIEGLSEETNIQVSSYPFFNLAGLSELGSTSKALQWAQQSFLSNPPIPRSARFIGEFLFFNNQMEGGIIKTGACEGRGRSEWF